MPDEGGIPLSPSLLEANSPRKHMLRTTPSSPTLGGSSSARPNPHHPAPLECGISIPLSPSLLEAKSPRPPANPREGAALIVALWVVMILAMLVSSMAFDMRVEANVTGFHRKRLKAEYLSRAGLEWAKVVLHRDVTESAEGDLILEDGQDEQLVIASINLSRGVAVSNIRKELGDGVFEVSIIPEEGRRNINLLTDEDWEEVLDQAGVPEDQWKFLIDSIGDWIDEDDNHRLHGAESDDPFYQERGYEVKNAPLDTIDELLLIKHFNEAIVYGGPDPEDPNLLYTGIANWLTTWGDGRVNVNTASREVLLTIPGIEEWVVDDILEYRTGIDGIPGTRDDGFESVDEVLRRTGLNPDLAGRITTADTKFVRVVSIGEVQGVRIGIWAVLQVRDKSVIPVYWREEAMP